MYFKNERLMMTEEQARNRAKELLDEYKVVLIAKYMFLEQQVKKQQEAIDKVIKIINYYGIDKEYNDNSVLRNVLKNMLDILKKVSE